MVWKRPASAREALAHIAQPLLHLRALQHVLLGRSHEGERRVDDLVLDRELIVEPPAHFGGEGRHVLLGLLHRFLVVGELVQVAQPGAGEHVGEADAVAVVEKLAELGAVLDRRHAPAERGPIENPVEQGLHLGIAPARHRAARLRAFRERQELVAGLLCCSNLCGVDLRRRSRAADRDQRRRDRT
jgi:hypothetical protein